MEMCCKMNTENKQVGEKTMANKKRSQSLYFKIKDDLKEQIISRQLKADDRIMSEAEICEYYNVSRITAKRALDELMWEGYITRKPGKGSFVTYHAIEHLLNGFYSISEEIRKNGLIPSTKLLEFECLRTEDTVVAEELKAKLGLSGPDGVYYIRRQRLASDEVIALETSYIPEKYFPGLSRTDLERGAALYAVFRTRYDCEPDRSQEMFSAHMVSKKEAQALGVRPESAALKVVRVSYAKDRAVEYTERLFRGDAYTYKVELKKRGD